MKSRFALAVATGLSLLFSLFVVFAVRVAPSVAQSTATAFQPVIGHDLKHDTSLPLRELARQTAPDRVISQYGINAVNRILPNRRFDPKFVQALKERGLSPEAYYRQYLAVPDPVIQTQPGLPYAPPAMPSAIYNFEGISQDEMQAAVPGINDNYIPPDTMGDIGYDPTTGKKYYVQWVNVAYAVWDVSAPAPVRQLTAAGNSLWSGFGGACETSNDGDPIVLFDQLAKRWMLSQFALPGGASGYHQCIAVSQTADPTGAWYRYDFMVSATKMNDYPHFGVWPDAYYMSVNQFTNGTSWGGAGAFAFDRARMLNGQAASFVSFDLYAANQNFGGQLPADWDGATPPPAGSPGFFFEVDDSAFLGTFDAMRLWKFHVDWTTPLSSTFGVAGQPNSTLAVTAFNLLPCVYLSGDVSRDCVPQPNVSSSAYLDAVGERLMHRVQYRVIDGQERVVLNHTVDAGNGRAGIRWYEVRDLGTTPAIYQQGTYAPSDTEYRWMGSLAMDHVGNIALGYSVSSSTVSPSVRYAGRLTDDPLGVLGQGEAVLVAGGGSQTDTASRWGDYSSMNVDPVDDCTFWYTQEYYPVSAPRDWHTRIGSFRFANCSLGPQGTLTGIVTHTASANPIVGARVAATLGTTQTFTTFTNQNGAYTLTLPEGTYQVSGAAYGYLPATLPPIAILSNTTTTLAIALDTAPVHVISGHVKDSATLAPLYATIAVTGTPFDPPSTALRTDPTTGFYSLTVAGGQSYQLTAAAWLHTPQTHVLTPTADTIENFNLIATTSNGGLAGWVRNAYTHDPIPEATITVTGAVQSAVQTDASGYFEVFDLPPGVYTATAEAALYSSTTITNIPVLTSNVTLRTFWLGTVHLEYAPSILTRTVTYGQAITDPAGLVISNTGLGQLTWALQEWPGGYTPLHPTVNNYLVVDEDYGGSSAQAITQALTSLGHSYDVISITNFANFPLASVQQYQAVLFAANLGLTGSGVDQLTAYLDAGGRLLIADDDLGYWLNSTTFYTTYLQAIYQGDNATSDLTGTVTGEDLMVGLNADISNDPFPDYYQPASSANVPIFRYDTAGEGNHAPAGSRIARQGYRAVYLPFNYASLGTVEAGDPIEATILRRVLIYLTGNPNDEVAWLSEAPISGTLSASITQPIQLTWDAAGIDQPGTYTASLHIDNNDPVSQNAVLPVVMTVQPAAYQGLLTGVVSTTGACDVNPAPLPGTAVQIIGRDQFSRTVAANSAGEYRYWLAEEHNPYTVTVSHAQYPTTTSNIALAGGSIFTQNFTLRLQEPCLTVEPTSVTVALAFREAATRTFTLTSQGVLPLNFEIYEGTGSEAMGGGPDVFGYTWLTTTYHFEDASGGTALSLGDDDSLDIILPFTFPFYVTATNILNIGNNGWAVVGGENSYVSAYNDPISAAPDYFLAPFWDDLDSTAGEVYWQVTGTAPHRQVIVEWKDRPHYTNVGTTTFEIILHENGNVVYQYQDVDFGDPAFNDGASATVGLRGPDAANSLQYSFDQPSLQDGLALCFVRPGNPPCNAVDLPWLSVTPISGTHLIGTPPTAQIINLTFDAARVPAVGEHHAQLLIAHNAPQLPVQIPITLTVTGYGLYLPIVHK